MFTLEYVTGWECDQLRKYCLFLSNNGFLIERSTLWSWHHEQNLLHIDTLYQERRQRRSDGEWLGKKKSLNSHQNLVRVSNISNACCESHDPLYTKTCYM